METEILFEEMEQPEVETTSKPHCGDCGGVDETPEQDAEG
jgi:hypothetical protein